MKIKDVIQSPFGTILSFVEQLPQGSVGSFLTTNGNVLHKIKAAPSNVWTEVLVEKTDVFSAGQDVEIVKIA